LQARQIVAKLLKTRLTITLEPRGTVAGFRITGEGSFLKFLAECLPSLQAVASPMPGSRNHIVA